MIDKVSITPPPPSLEEEQVQKETSSQEKPKPRAIDEVAKEGHIVEYGQKPSQDVKEQAIGSIETKLTEGESS